MWRSASKPSYSVRDVVELSRESESTVRRLIRDGHLVRMPGSNPCQLTAESVLAYLKARVADGPQLPEGIQATGDRAADTPSLVVESPDHVAAAHSLTALEAEAARLREENERLRNTILALRHTASILLDDLGAYTTPKIPNR